MRNVNGNGLDVSLVCGFTRADGRYRNPLSQLCRQIFFENDRIFFPLGKSFHDIGRFVIANFLFIYLRHLRRRIV